MTTVSCSSLRPLVQSGHKGRQKNRAATIRQLGSYIWVPPSENPQGLGNSTFGAVRWQEKSGPIGGSHSGKPKTRTATGLPFESSVFHCDFRRLVHFSLEIGRAHV